MTLTAFVGVSLSLLVSVFARTERAALNMVPLLLIPPDIDGRSHCPL